MLNLLRRKELILVAKEKRKCMEEKGLIPPLVNLKRGSKKQFIDFIKACDKQLNKLNDGGYND